MAYIKDISNQYFGRWHVIKYDPETSMKKGRSYWICECECGKIVSVMGRNLINGISKSCGCLNRERSSAKNFLDLTGQKYGRLLVLKLDNERSTTKIKYWICKCKCGNVLSVRAGLLRNGNTRSCGCLNKEIHSKRNELELFPELGFGKCYINNSERYFVFDIEDIDIVRLHGWYEYKDYIVATNNISHIVHRFHRMVMEKYYGNISGLVIDHIDHNTLNNRKENLRLCTQQENIVNSRPTTNTGEKYIHYNENKGYIVSFPNEGERYFNSFNEALLYRNDCYAKYPNQYWYNPIKDKKIINNEMINPFIDMNGNDIKRDIINPFIFI